MADTFVILDDGETLIVGEWSPPPEVFEQRMIALANRYDNMLTPLLAAREIAIGSTQIHFDQQKGPDGIDWAPLDPDYLKWKTQHGGPEDEILVLDGTGKKAATSENAWIISEDALWFVPAALPEYMSFHQAGSQSGALGSALNKIRTSMTKPTFTSAEAEALKSGTGKGRNLPKREFIGLNEFDIALIEAEFDDWFGEQLIEEFPTGGGGSVRPMGYNILGSLPIIGFTSSGQPRLSSGQFGRK